ncbi:hypothetical protein ACTXJU_14680 [Glutamicibacter ardleyensis]
MALQQGLGFFLAAINQIIHLINVCFLDGDEQDPPPSLLDSK